MQLFCRSKRFRPKVTASAIALTIAGMSSGAGTSEAAEQTQPAFQDAAQSSGPPPNFFAQRHRPWRHHVYQRGATG